MSTELSPSLLDSSNKNTTTGEQKADSQPASKSSESHRIEENTPFDVIYVYLQIS